MYTCSVLVGVQSQSLLRTPKKTEETLKLEFDLLVEKQTTYHINTERIRDETVDNRKDNETVDNDCDEEPNTISTNVRLHKSSVQAQGRT